MDAGLIVGVLVLVGVGYFAYKRFTKDNTGGTGGGGVGPDPGTKPKRR